MKHILEFHGWMYEKYLKNYSLNDIEGFLENGEWNAIKKYEIDEDLSYTLIEKYACKCVAELFPKSHIGAYSSINNQLFQRLAKDYIEICDDYVSLTIYSDNRNCFVANDNETAFWFLFDVKVFWDGKELNDMESV